MDFYNVYRKESGWRIQRNCDGRIYELKSIASFRKKILSVRDPDKKLWGYHTHFTL